ncbi:hypothetical protein P9112_003529 [Eukaryota sp. TZLM1-RC]
MVNDQSLLQEMVSKGIRCARSSAQNHTSIIENPGLMRGCPAMQKFCRAVQSEGRNRLADIVYAWHGTPAANIPQIFYNGFDPQKRNAKVSRVYFDLFQAGEFFSSINNPTYSHSYCRGDDYLILTAIMKGSNFKDHGSYHVVNNDISGSTTHCLPICAVRVMSQKSAVSFSFIQQNPVAWSFGN